MSAGKGLHPFTIFTAIAVPIDIANCDTDQLIPARFLRIAEDDPQYPQLLLHDVRFNEDGTPKDFIYNQEPYCRARIVVGDINWGCGSSREMAVTVLTANGVRAVIAPSFGDIHYSNCIKNGVLPVRLQPETCSAVRRQLHESPGAQITIDLAAQTVLGPDQTVYSFDIDLFDKERLEKGLDDIGLTLSLEQEIAQFKTQYHARHRWVAQTRYPDA